jgi:hypothetical protein
MDSKGNMVDPAKNQSSKANHRFISALVAQLDRLYLGI